MIIYGSRETTLKTKNFEEHDCTNCGQKGTICCTGFSRHAHIFWIPLFPYYKRKVVWCSNCEEEFRMDELSPELQAEVKEFSRKNKTPFWQWVGLLLITVSIVTALIDGRRGVNNTEKFFNSPEINDVYCVKLDEGYSLMYICDFNEDSVFFISSDYVSSKMKDVEKLHNPKYYELDQIYGFSREELDEYYKDNDFIKKIWRNLPYSTKPAKISKSSNDDEDDE